LCHWLILEQVADLAHAHVAAGCDNSPTVAWATRLLSTRSTVAAHLLRILALRMLAQQASPLTTYHLPGHLNTMADTASCSFTSHPSASTFLSHFSSLFPLQQNDSWHLCQLPTSTCGKIYSAMLTTTSPLVWWLRITNNATVTGNIGSSFSRPVSPCTFKAMLPKTGSQSSRLSPSGHDAAPWDVDTKLKLAWSRMPFQLSERPLNWLVSPTLSFNTEPKPTTNASTDK